MYLRCVLDESVSGESMALKVVTKINGKLKFLSCKKKFLTSKQRRIFCNALIQPHCVQLGNQILLENKKEDTNYAK